MLLFSIIAFAQPPTCVHTIKEGKQINEDPPIIDPTGTGGTNTLGPDDERIVYWVHGLGGNVGSWAKAADASTYKEWNTGGFEARKLQSRTISYDENASLLNAAGYMRSDIDAAVGGQNTENIDPNNNFIIAHSQGGLVSSALMYLDFGSQPRPAEERYYGGVVTVCSSMQGAAILNHTEDLYQMSEDACQALTAGPKEEFTSSSLFKLIDFFKRGDQGELVEEAVDGVCEFVKEGIMPSLFSGNVVPTTENFSVGADPINWFNSVSTPGVDRVAFYAVEPNDNLLWRTMEYMAESPNATENGYWGANEDFDEIWDIVVGMRNEYESKYIHNKNLAIFYEVFYGMPCNGWQWVFQYLNCSINEGKYYDAINRRNGWKKGLDWIDSASDVYRANIGAIEVQSTSTTYCRCLNDDFLDPMTGGEPFTITQGPCVPSSDCLAQNEFIEVTLNTINKPSDGVVLAESAMDVNGDNETAAAVKLANTSHMQSRNNSELKDALTNLYNGEYGVFFTTEVRD